MPLRELEQWFTATEEAKKLLRLRKPSLVCEIEEWINKHNKRFQFMRMGADVVDPVPVKVQKSFEKVFTKQSNHIIYHVLNNPFDLQSKSLPDSLMVRTRNREAKFGGPIVKEDFQGLESFLSEVIDIIHNSPQFVEVKRKKMENEQAEEQMKSQVETYNSELKQKHDRPPKWASKYRPVTKPKYEYVSVVPHALSTASYEGSEDIDGMKSFQMTPVKDFKQLHLTETSPIDYDSSFHHNEDENRVLQEFAEQGWELVSVSKTALQVSQYGGIRYHPVFYFKRELQLIEDDEA